MTLKFLWNKNLYKMNLKKYLRTIILFYTCLYGTVIYSKMPFPTENFIWGDTELISFKHKIIKSELLTDFPIKINQKVTEESINEAFLWCESKIEHEILPDSAECNFIPDPTNKKFHFIINLSKNPFS